MSHNQVLHCLNGYRAVAYSPRLSIVRENCAGNVFDTRNFAIRNRLIFSQSSLTNSLEDALWTANSINVGTPRNTFRRAQKDGFDSVFFSAVLRIVSVHDPSTRDGESAEEDDIALEKKNEEQ